MGAIIIEGSTTPSTYLAMGARLTVERTPFINKLIRGGFVVVVGTPPAVKAPAPAPVVEAVPVVVDEPAPLPTRSKRKAASAESASESE